MKLREFIKSLFAPLFLMGVPKIQAKTVENKALEDFLNQNTENLSIQTSFSVIDKNNVPDFIIKNGLLTYTDAVRVLPSFYRIEQKDFKTLMFSIVYNNLLVFCKHYAEKHNIENWDQVLLKPLKEKLKAGELFNYEQK